MEIRTLPVSQTTPEPAPVEGVCSVGVWLPGESSPGDLGPAAFHLFLFISCQRDGVVMKKGAVLGDLRDTPAGSFAPVAVGLSFWEQSSDGYASPSLSFFLEDAAGGAAPFPGIVTADFQRTLLVKGKILFSQLQNGKSTAGYSPVEISLLFNMTAADFRGEQGVACQVCAG